MASITSITNENNDKIFNVDLEGDSQITLQTADTYVDRNIIFRVDGANEVGVSSWDDLTDKPFGEEVKTVELTFNEVLSDAWGSTVYSADIKGFDINSLTLTINGEIVDFDWDGEDDGCLYYEGDELYIEFNMSDDTIIVESYLEDEVESITVSSNAIKLLDSKYLDINQILSHVKSKVIDCTGMDYNQIKEIMNQLDNYNKYCFIYNYLNTTYYLTKAVSWDTKYVFSSVTFYKSDSDGYLPRIEYLYVTQSGNESGDFYPIDSSSISGVMRFPTKMIYDEEYGDYEEIDYGQEGQILATTGEYDKFKWTDFSWDNLTNKPFYEKGLSISLNRTHDYDSSFGEDSNVFIAEIDSFEQSENIILNLDGNPVSVPFLAEESGLFIYTDNIANGTYTIFVNGSDSNQTGIPAHSILLTTHLLQQMYLLGMANLRHLILSFYQTVAKA